MSLIEKYLSKEEQLKNLRAELESLANDPRYQHEMEFKNKLEALMNEYDKTPRDVIVLLHPEYYNSGDFKTKASLGAKRKLQTYRNPNTGEIIETRSGNHKGLRAWKEKYGEEMVKSWLVEAA